MKALIALTILIGSTTLSARELTCGYAPYPSPDQNWPTRTGVVRATEINGEYQLQISIADRRASVHYAAYSQMLTHWFSLPGGDEMESSKLHVPSGVAYVSPLSSIGQALWCWLED